MFFHITFLKTKCFCRMEDKTEFCINVALPEIDQATENLQLDEATKQDLFKGVLGTLLKLLYGVIWQVM